MATETRISEATYERLALAEPGRKWELLDGHLRQKPSMTAPHNWLEIKLGYMSMAQFDWSLFQVRVDAGRVSRPEATSFVPDVFVVPIEVAARFFVQDEVLEVYDQPLPLVVEVWSPSTGDYDVDTKIPVYRQRGDLEIWRIHPYERTLTRWVRRPDGTYDESVHHGGIVSPVALTSVTIDLDVLFDA